MRAKPPTGPRRSSALRAALLALALAACGSPGTPIAKQQPPPAVELAARQALRPRLTPAALLDRTRAETRPLPDGWVVILPDGWVVIFHDAAIPCTQFSAPGACGRGPLPASPPIYQDLYVCVAADARTVRQTGATRQAFDLADPCPTVGGPPAATAMPAIPAPTRPPAPLTPTAVAR